jgi:hypothetical protein
MGIVPNFEIVIAAFKGKFFKYLEGINIWSTVLVEFMDATGACVSQRADPLLTVMLFPTVKFGPDCLKNGTDEGCGLFRKIRVVVSVFRFHLTKPVGEESRR